MTNYYTFEERQLIEKRIKDGVSTSQIAKLINRTNNSLRNEIGKNGGRQLYTAQESHERALECKRKKVNGPHHRMCPNQEEDVKSLIEQGFGYLDIQFELGITCRHLRKYVKKLNIKPQKKQPKQFLYDKVSALEMQLQIVIEELEELKNKCHNLP